MFPAVLTVSAVNVGTVGVVLILSVLVEVALLKEANVLEPEWLTIPPALLVIPVILPEPLTFTVPVLVKLASTVVHVAIPLMANVPAFVIVVGLHVPPVIFTVPKVFDKIPVPVNEVAEFIVPVLVSVTPVTVSAVAQVNVPVFVYAPVNVTLGIEVVVEPLIVLPVPPKVYAPVPVELKVVALFVKLPLMVCPLVVVLVHEAPVLSVTSPVNTFARAPDKLIVPVMFVVPVTCITREQVSEPPLLIVKLPVTAHV